MSLSRTPQDWCRSIRTRQEWKEAPLLSRTDLGRLPRAGTSSRWHHAGCTTAPLLRRSAVLSAEVPNVDQDLMAGSPPTALRASVHALSPPPEPSCGFVQGPHLPAGRRRSVLSSFLVLALRLLPAIDSSDLARNLGPCPLPDR
ncbi:hypothetical protein GSI_15567 [Ganoderma sinense ZZ0214-1]|uniref:Uncharacterized protein n=1 Tax=Ganoderma sinense ZZ0214-1 TaxID=1077348 RepID=A0A2G8RMZ3_9APHY|nr:hypothetical protein GSI_15567 [Ganoderma sinense ZZ0214-1]